MHGLIIELKTKKTYSNNLLPSTVCAQTGSYNIDYADQIDDLPSEILEGSIQMLERRDDIILNKGDNTLLFNKRKLLASYYERFVDWLKKLQNVSFEAFAGEYANYAESVEYYMYNLDKAYEDEDDIFIFIEETLMPLTFFLRHYDTDRWYYIGNILDYHK